MESIFGLVLIILDAITTVFSISNLRRIKGFSLANGGMNWLFFSIALISMGIYLQ